MPLVQTQRGAQESDLFSITVLDKRENVRPRNNARRRRRARTTRWWHEYRFTARSCFPRFSLRKRYSNNLSDESRREITKPRDEFLALISVAARAHIYAQCSALWDILSPKREITSEEQNEKGVEEIAQLCGEFSTGEREIAIFFTRDPSKK